MNLRKLRVFNVGALALMFAGAAALADDGVQIKIINDNTSDIIVTVYDMNGVPPRIVVTGQRINGFSSVPITVTLGRDGKAHVSWTAVSVDTNSRLCGNADRPALDSDTAVHTYAKTPCSNH